MKKVLEYVESPEENTWSGVKWALLLIGCDVLRVIMFNWTWNTNIRTALRLKSACTNLLYQKIIRLNSLGNKSTGEVKILMYHVVIYAHLHFVPIIVLPF